MKLEGAAADKDLTPTVRGLTDKDTIEDWDLPFEIQRGRIKPDDDQYWTKYGATPKAFVSLATGRRLWASRFGQTTSLRIRPTAETTAQTLAQRLDLDPVAQGFVFRPIKDQALAAAAGTTPFGVLFLAFSFFVIAAAVMLVVLLVPLGDRTTRQTRGAALGPGVSPPADHATSGGRRPVGGDRGKPDRHAGRRGLRGAHALRTANLVAAGHRHAVSHAARFLAKPG